MKRLILLAFITLSILLNADTIRQTIRFTYPEIKDSDKYQQLIIEGTKNSGDIGNPLIPYKALSFILPEGHELESFVVVPTSNKQILTNLNLDPAQGVKPLSSTEKTPFTKNEKLYQTNDFFPAKLEGNFQTQYLQGLAIGMLSFTPIKYNPVSGIAEYYSECEIIIETKESQKSREALQNLVINSSIKKFLPNFVENPELLNSYNYRDIDDKNILIICGDELNENQNNISSLLALYTQRGFQYEIFSTSELTTTGVDLQEKIRNFIIEKYQVGNLSHVLLAGDSEIIPFRGLYCSVESSSTYEDAGIPSDIYYSALDGTWNDDNNELWGEIGEEDLLPDVSVGRLPFSTLTELEKMTHKVLEYQTNPVLGELDKPLLAGEHLYDDPLSWGSDYLDLLIGNQNENGYETTGIPVTDDYQTLYDRDQGQWGPNQLLNFVNDGGSFLHHSGHSNWNYTMRLSNNDITNENFYNVNGEDHNFQLLYTHGCICGAFDSDDCIAEEMLKIDNFLHTFIGNSRYGWFNEGQTEGPSGHLHREFVNALYELQNDEVGETHRLSKIATSPWVTAPGQHEEGALRWCFYECNVLGDPALALRTTEPKSFEITYENTIDILAESYTFSISMNNGDLENMTATIVSDQILGKVEIENGDVIIPFEGSISGATSAQLWITGENIIPTSYELFFIDDSNPSVRLIDYELIENNNIIEFSDNLELNLTLRNLSNLAATNVSVSATSTNSYIGLTENLSFFGDFTALEEKTNENAFGIAIDPNIPDQHNVVIDLTITSDEGTWTDQIAFIVNSPVFEILGYTLEDSNDINYSIHSGESGSIALQVKNSGHVNVDGISVNYDSENASGMGEGFVDELNVDSFTTITFPITIDSGVSISDDISINVMFSYSGGEQNLSFMIPIGTEKENFESGDFSRYPWQTIGNGWIAQEFGFEGGYGARTSLSELSQTSSLYLTVEALEAAHLQFKLYVENQEFHEALIFLVDGIEMDRWYQNGWQDASFNMTEGIHQLEWRYDRAENNQSIYSYAKLDEVIFTGLEVQYPRVTTNTNSLSFNFSESSDSATQTLELTNQSSEEITVNLLKQPFNRADASFVAIEENSYSPGEINEFNLHTNIIGTANILRISLPNGGGFVDSVDLLGENSANISGSIENNMLSWNGEIVSNQTATFEVNIPSGVEDFKIQYELVTADETIVFGNLLDHSTDWLSFENSSLTITSGETINMDVTADWSELTFSDDYRANIFVQPSMGNMIIIPVVLENVVESDINEVEIFSLIHYPNPFNLGNINRSQSSIIQFSLPNDSKVNLSVYNIKGQKVRELENRNFLKGTHKVSWDGLNNSNQEVASGVYFYRIKTERETATKKLLILK